MDKETFLKYTFSIMWYLSKLYLNLFEILLQNMSVIQDVRLYVFKLYKIVRTMNTS